jgi:hypothetical protein
MTENPYLPPQTEPLLFTRSRRITRLTGGTIVFVSLGMVLLILGGFVIVSVNQQSNLQFNVRYGMTTGAVLLALLGGLLIVHGIIRKESTAAWVVFALVSFFLFGLVVSVLTSF